jgi:hypothetical protein
MANGSYQIHSEQRGPHWIAWVSRDGSAKPHGSIVLVAETRELAEARAREYAVRSAEPASYGAAGRSSSPG